MPDINRLLADALDAEAQESKAWLAVNDLHQGASRSITRRRRARAGLVTGLVAASLIALSTVAAAALQERDTATVSVPSPTVEAVWPSPSESPSASASPSQTPSFEWSDVAEEDKPALSTETAAGEPASRVMEPWVWDYVTEAWSLEVFSAFGPDQFPLESQALLLRAPNDDLFRVTSLPTEMGAVTHEWDREANLAWLTFSGFGDSWQVVQVDLETGVLNENWLPADIADPYNRGWASGAWNVGKITDLGDGRELWANFTYRATFDGFFIREGDGSWTPMLGMDKVLAAVQGGSTNGAMDPGIEAWFSPSENSLAILFQWGAYNSGTMTFHTSSAQWLVVKLDSAGGIANDTVQVSDVFVPTPVLCSAQSSEVSVNPQAAVGYTVTAGCGTQLWELTPMTSTAVDLGSAY